MITAKVGLCGQYVVNGGGGGDGPRPGTITKVHSAALVDMAQTVGTSTLTSVPFVDVGGTPPAPGAGHYFQAIDAAS